MADTTSLAKINLIPKVGPGRVGFAARRKSLSLGVNTVDGRIWTDLDGTKRPMSLDNALVLTGATTLKATDSGSQVIFNSTTSFAVTLPPAQLGLSFEFFVRAVGAAGNGHTIAVNGATSKFWVRTIAVPGVAGHGIKHTTAGVIGDTFYCFSDGTDWYGGPIDGTSWAAN